jgi:histone-binding protein RBBP4
MSSAAVESMAVDLETEGDNLADDFETLDPAILAEYKAWKKNTPYLYDLAITHSLEWPSLTVEWLPDVVSREYHDTHKVVLGTHTSGEEPNYLIVADVILPNNEREIDAKNYREDLKEVGGYGGTVAKIDIKIKMAHDGEVNRARANPQNPFQIATKSPLSTVFVFDYSKHSSLKSAVPPAPKPQHTCLGHTKEGYGLSWSPVEVCHLLSGSDDAKICMWDLREAGPVVNALNTWTGHNDVVEDVDWHRFSKHIFGSVGDDSRLIIWDSRKNEPVCAIDGAHDSDINCLSFNPFNENLVATGGSDHKAKVWDLRYLKNPLNVLEHHKDGVYQLSWSPHAETLLATGSADRRVCVWDLANVGLEQTPEEAAEGAPELIFVHGGHTAKVSDLSWNRNKPFTMASVSEGHIMQVWTMAEAHYLRRKVAAAGGDDGMADDDLEDNVAHTASALEAKGSSGK